MANGERKLAGILPMGAAGVGTLVYRIMIGRLRRRVAAELRDLPPADPDVVAAESAGLPVYPGAELDPRATAEARWWGTSMARWMRPFTWVMERLFGPGLADMCKWVTAIYTVEAPAVKVLAWYDKVLRAAGWKHREMPDEVRKRVRYPSRFYSKGDETLFVAVRPAENSGFARIRLSRG